MSITPLLGWRDYLHIRPDKIRGSADAYCARAEEIRDIIAQVLHAGFSTGAEQALTDLAEEDSVDFCIMVDLANHVDIPGIEPLDKEDTIHLLQFLEAEPWRSLVVDTEIAVSLAMLRAYGESEEETIWYMGDPHLLSTLSKTFESVNKEQFGRFIAEINSLCRDRGLRFDDELMALSRASANRAADRLGLQPPILFN